MGSFFAVLPFDASYSATASDGAGGSAQTVAVGDCVNVRGAVVDSPGVVILGAQAACLLTEYHITSFYQDM